MAHRCAVSAGQRYVKIYELTHDRTEWEVVDVKVVGAALPHALLVNCRDRSDTRTVSCAELTGGGGFALAGVTGDGPGRDRPGRPGSGRAKSGRSRSGRARSGRSRSAGRLEAGSARMGRLLRQITLAVRRFKRSLSRAPIRVETAAAAAPSEHRQAN